jgi:hypothetical protein
MTPDAKAGVLRWTETSTRPAAPGGGSGMVGVARQYEPSDGVSVVAIPGWRPTRVGDDVVWATDATEYVRLDDRVTLVELHGGGVYAVASELARTAVDGGRLSADWSYGGSTFGVHARMADGSQRMDVVESNMGHTMDRVGGSWAWSNDFLGSTDTGSSTLRQRDLFQKATKTYHLPKGWLTNGAWWGADGAMVLLDERPANGHGADQLVMLDEPDARVVHLKLGHATSAAWSDDMLHAAVLSGPRCTNQGGTCELTVVDIVGRTHPLPNVTGYAGSMAFSADGTELALVRRTGSGSEIDLVDAARGGLHRIHAAPAGAEIRDLQFTDR